MCVMSSISGPVIWFPLQQIEAGTNSPKYKVFFFCWRNLCHPTSQRIYVYCLQSYVPYVNFFLSLHVKITAGSTFTEHTLEICTRSSLTVTGLLLFSFIAFCFASSAMYVSSTGLDCTERKSFLLLFYFLFYIFSFSLFLQETLPYFYKSLIITFSSCSAM